MTHDKFCLAPCCEWMQQPCDCQCICDLIQEIRADEREKVEAPIRELVADSKHCELPFYDIDHDGAECCIRMKTIRKVMDGEWTVEDPTIEGTL